MIRLDDVLAAMARAAAAMPATLRAELLSPAAGVIRRGRTLEEALLDPMSRELLTEYWWVHPECWLGRKEQPPEAVLLLGNLAQDGHRCDPVGLRLLARWRAPVKVMLTGTFGRRDIVERDWARLLHLHCRAWPEAPETRYALIAPAANGLSLACTVMAPDGTIVRPFSALDAIAGRVA